MNWQERYASEADARASVVTEAFSWVGTPWAHAHMLKGGGVDCAMLLLAVYSQTGLVEFSDPRPYPAQWYQHRETSKFVDIITRHAHPVAIAMPGDVAMFNFGKHPAHGAIIVDADRMIHAYAPRRKVILDNRGAMPGHFDSYWSLFPENT